MAILNVRAFILHRREVTESSLVLSVFSDRAGKLNLLAKGARRKKSPFLGRIELFSLCDLTYYESRRRGLNILSESDVVNPMVDLRKSLPSFMTACYLAELVDMGTCVSASMPKVFDLLRESLGAIDRFPDSSVLKRYYELHLLSHLGYSLWLHACACCHEKVKALRSFSAKAGGMLCAGCTAKYVKPLPVSPGTLAVLSHLNIRPLKSVRRLLVTPRQAEEARQLLRSAVVYYLERQPKTERVPAMDD